MMRNTKLLVVGIILSSLKTIIAIEPLSFSFVVLGDRTGGADHVVFEQVVKQIKLINPDFIINIGDLIEGYTSDTQKINQEWDLIFSTLGKLKEKFYFTPGNHDIWDQISSQIYLNRTGYKKPYYAFSAHKCHFVIIDNSQEEKIYEFDSVQLKWLNSTLAKYKRNDIVFCFMHKSFWKDAYINNKPDTLHKLFVKYGVDYVFSGHDHFYCQLIWDGITYTQVGPSGSRYKQYKKEEYGAFQNFVLVTVKNNDVIIKVIKPDGSVLNSDIVTLPDIKELEKIEQSLQIVQNEDTVEVLINNITDFSFNSRGKWEFNPKNWTIVPQETVVLIPPHGNKSFKFHWQTANESVYPLPRFSIFYPYSKLGTKTYKVEKLFPVHRQAQCSKVSGVIKIDGQLNEKVWQKKSINIFGSSEGNVSNTDPWWVSFAYDKDNLYIGAILYDIKPDSISTKITERDDKVYNDDHINIILQPHVTQDTYYQFFINARGTVMDRKCYMIGKDSKKEFKWNSNIIVQTRIVKSKDFNGWILEAALPLKDITFKVPQTWGFNIARFQKRKEEVSVFSVPFEHNPKTFATLKFIY